MDIRFLSEELAIGGQLSPDEVAGLKQAGIAAVICNRPDGEGEAQPPFRDIQAQARQHGIEVRYLPVVPGQVTAEHGAQFARLLAELPKPVLAYCRTGKRAEALWELARNAMPEQPGSAGGAPVPHDGAGEAPEPTAQAEKAASEYEVVIVGGGAAGIATAASLLARSPGLGIAIIEPSDTHAYQPGWTLMGGGEFELASTYRRTQDVMPAGVTWLKAAAAGFDPARRLVLLDGARSVRYGRLVVCPGLKLDWDAIEGLRATLGRNGVTSNYRGELAAYTWELVRGLRGGRALFTQPPMPIKCAGAPQKAMYLSADHWKRKGTLAGTTVEFCNAGGTLFGVADYVPPLMDYVGAYGIELNFGENLVAVDGPRRVARFRKNAPDGSSTVIEKQFDMLHVVPPQVAPDFIRSSPLADAAGWVDVDPATLRHKRYPDIFALGDVAGTANAKTAAAARKQAPVVAHNVLASLGKASGTALYDGHGSCPLTVERGKVVLAEFTYGGKLSPSFPSWLIESTKASRLAWLIKRRILPPLYWHGMLKGRELLVRPSVTQD